MRTSKGNFQFKHSDFFTRDFNIIQVITLLKFILSITLLVCSFQTFSAIVTKDTLTAFTEQVKQLKTVEEYQQILSEDLLVKIKVGTGYQGLTINYNKSEFLAVIEKSIDQMSKPVDMDFYDIKVLSDNSGEFKFIYYSKELKTRVWAIYKVIVENAQIKIVNMEESV